MALLFTGGDTDKVEYTIASAATDNMPLTIWAWVYPTVFGNGYGINQQNSVAGLGYRNLNIRATGQVDVEVDFSGVDAFARSQDAAGNRLTTNEWWFVAGTVDGSYVPRIYLGKLSTMPYEVTVYNNQTTGTVGPVSDSGGTGTWGNRSSVASLSFGGRIACGGRLNKACSLAELTQIWSGYFNIPGTVNYVQLGWNGTGTQPDWSGNLQNGTVTGATVTDHVPLGFFSPPKAYNLGPDSNIALDSGADNPANWLQGVKISY